MIDRFRLGQPAGVPTYERFRREAARLHSVHPDVEVHLVWTGPDEAITLDLVRSLPAKRRQGLAEAALRDVTVLADEWGVALRLVVEPVRGDDVDPAQLVRWYAHHGFIVSDVRERDGAPIMTRPAPKHP